MANPKANAIIKMSAMRPTLLVVLLIFISAIVVVELYQQGSFVSTSNSNSNININSNGGNSGTIRKTCDIESALNRFDRTFDERRKARQEKVHAQQQLPKSGVALTFWDLYEPEAVCFTEERMGYGIRNDMGSGNYHRHQALEAKVKRYDSFGDGPKFVCGVDVISSLLPSTTPSSSSSSSSASSTKRDDDDRCLVYSVGSANDVSFEIAAQKFMGCEIHTFDPTLAKETFVGNKYATFHQWGLGEDGVTKEIGQFKWTGKSFMTIFQELGHVHRTIDILKIDCEGCEWATMPPLFDLIAAGTVKVHQIQIEMHNTVASSNVMLHSFFEKMDRAKMRIVHKERNHWGCLGYKCLEYAFVSEEFLRTANQASVCQ